MAELNDDFLIVAAIDFGTTFSGYAFSLVHDFKIDPMKIHASSWAASSGGLISLKTPTCVLFEPSGKFHSFGYEAEDKYSDLALDDEHHAWFYFRRFKMELYNNMRLNRQFVIKDDKGKTMTAMKVFSSSLRYLKDHMLLTCQKSVPDINKGDIRWVLTVPAIWSDSSKQFMREAAGEAGIESNQLLIALEPEAASLFCKNLPVQKADGGFSAFKSGCKYLVMDAGGGTIDITLHQVQIDGTLKEIHKANGGDWGGTKVDDAYKNFLADIAGNDVYAQFCSANRADMLEIFRDFEVKKRNIKAEGNDKITFRIPQTLDEMCRKKKGKNIGEVIKTKPKYNSKLKVVGDKLRSENSFAIELFNTAVDKVVDHVKNIIRDSKSAGVSCILMVGGFSESPVMQQRFRKAFGNIRIIVPQDAGLAVLKGAVIYGHCPSVIKTRICKYTYGVETSVLFDEDKHPASKLYVTKTGERRCLNLFSLHVENGKEVNIGEPQTSMSYGVSEADQIALPFSVYATADENPEFTTDPGCKLIGSLRVAMEDTSKGLYRSATVSMTFGNTELQVEATDNNTGETTIASFDFLE